MICGSVCSGIGAPEVAWRTPGWRFAFASEIEAFPRAVLRYHHPDIPLHGDFTTVRAGEYDAIDLLVGGTPCQSFSVAGLRGGLDDDRGNLSLEFLRLAGRLRPMWLVWENVPGVLSSGGRRDFGSILGGMVELGYGFAYRILDAQFFGVPQRRRRVFVVGHLGDWRRAAAVLFERHSLQGHSPPSRKAGQGITYSTAPSLTGSGRGVARSSESRGQDPVVAARTPVAYRTSPNCGSWETGDRIDALTTGADSTSHVLAFGGSNQSGPINVATACRAHANRLDFDSETFVTHSLRGEGFDASEDEPGRGTPLVTVAFDLRGREGGAMPEGSHDTANIRAASGGSSRSYVAGSTVRRLTPRECERLQGFPDDYTLIPWRKGMAPDGPRYKALGNSMAVPVMAWIGQRIQQVEDLTRDLRDSAISAEAEMTAA